MTPSSGPPTLAEQIRRRWAGVEGIPPDLVALLAAAPRASPAEITDALVEDAEQRWDRGLPATLEHYLAALPGPAADPQVARALLMLEFTRRTTEPPGVVRADLDRRLPGHAGAIEAIAELAALMRSQEDADTPALEPGLTLGKYRLVEWLGAGSFGEVWCAWDTLLERYIALKILPPEEPGSSMLGAVLREAKSAASIDHEHVVKVHDAGRFDDPRRCYIDTLLVGDPAPSPADPKRVAAGRSLAAIVSEPDAARAAPGPREAARLMEAVCRGAAAAHARGIVHRDIKPSNILVTPSGRPLLGDFGLSLLSLADALAPEAHASIGTGQATLAGRITGTPTFMAPEQAAGQPASPASDVYSLGATLRFVLTGKLPFEPSGRHSTDARWDVIEQVRRCELSPLTSERPDLPPDLSAISDKAMAREPADRYISAAAMAADLAAYLARRPVSARPAGAARTAGLWASRNPVVLALSLTIVLLGGLGLWRYIVNIGRERDRAVAAERATELQLRETERARATAESVNEFLQSIISAAAPDLLGRHATILEATRFAAREIEPQFKDQPHVEADIRRNLGLIYGALGENDEAREQLTRAVELSRAARGEEHRDTLASRKSLAMLNWNTSPSAALGKIVEQAVDDMRRVLGPDDTLTLSAETDLAGVYAADHRFARTHDLLASIVEARRAGGTLDTRTGLQAQQLLAAAKSMVGKPEESIALLNDLIERERRLLGPDHYLVSMARIDLASSYEGLQKWEQAAEQYRLAMEGLRRQLPAGNEYVYHAARGVAAIYSGHLDRAEEGLDLLKPTFDAYLARPDREKYATASGLDVLGCLYAKLNRLPEAEASLREAREQYAQIIGNANNMVVKKVERVLADVLARAGKLDEAEQLRKRNE